MKDLKAPLERKRPLFFVVGLVLALSVTLVSFEWRTPYQKPVIIGTLAFEEAEYDFTPVVILEPEKKLEKPAPPEIIKIPTEIQIVDNNTAITDSDPVDITPVEPDLPKGEPKPIEPDVVDPPISWASKMPVYCAGERAMFDILSKNLKYPEIPRVNGVSGTVHVQFVVDRNGKVSDAKVLRPIDPWLDAEALRVAKLLDCFEPGQQGGRSVSVYFVLPVKFVLSR